MLVVISRRIYERDNTDSFMTFVTTSVFSLNTSERGINVHTKHEVMKNEMVIINKRTINHVCVKQFDHAYYIIKVSAL